MNGYSPNGISYSEGQVPLGLGAASGICDHGYCPQESDEVAVNPREGTRVAAVTVVAACACALAP